jgi:hypothetical protein
MIQKLTEAQHSDDLQMQTFFLSFWLPYRFVCSLSMSHSSIKLKTSKVLLAHTDHSVTEDPGCFCTITFKIILSVFTEKLAGL